MDKKAAITGLHVKDESKDFFILGIYPIVTVTQPYN